MTAYPAPFKEYGRRSVALPRRSEGGLFGKRIGEGTKRANYAASIGAMQYSKAERQERAPPIKAKSSRSRFNPRMLKRRQFFASEVRARIFSPLPKPQFCCNSN
jgi:hypothetical protein